MLRGVRAVKRRAQEGLADIESALQKMDEIASNQEGIAAEEALILKGFVSPCISCTYGSLILRLVPSPDI